MLAAAILATLLSAPPPHRVVFDAHTHISPSELPRFHGILDEVGIRWVLNLSGMFPGGPLETQLAAARRSGRMLVAVNLPWRAAFAREDFPELAVAMLRHAKSLGVVALKIEKALGLVVRKPDGSRLAVDDPWLDPIWRECGRLGLPVVIHTADPEAFWRPVDPRNERYEELSAHPRWSNFGQPVPPFADLLAELEHVIARHPGTTFVSVHFGNHAEDPFAVGAQLERYPNLYVDLAARVPELGRHDPERLRGLFIQHRERILFGTDLGVSDEDFLMLGSYGTEPNRRDEVGPFFQAHYRWLEARDDQPSMTPIQGRWTIHGLGLPEDVLQAIYAGNAMALFGVPTSHPPYWRLSPRSARSTPAGSPE